MNKRSAEAKAETIRRRSIRQARRVTTADVETWLNISELKGTVR